MLKKTVETPVKSIVLKAISCRSVSGYETTQTTIATEHMKASM